MFPTRITSLIAALAFASATGATLAACAPNESDSPAAETAEGTFAAVTGAPAGADKAAGKVTLERRADGTTVTAELTGLTPKGAYVAHVHNKPCAEDSGGKHYQFEPGGSEMPPNEIHLALDADDEGKADATTDADRKAGPEAVSVVVHYQDKKLLCADL